VRVCCVQSKVGAQEEKLIVKQTAELGALRKRVQAGRLEHNRQRKVDLERLLQRYANVKVALEKQQGREMTALTRELKSVTCVRLPPLHRPLLYAQPPSNALTPD
jgi:hypothetical protein